MLLSKGAEALRLNITELSTYTTTIHQKPGCDSCLKQFMEWWVGNTSLFISCTFVPSVISHPVSEHCYTKGNFHTSHCEFRLGNKEIFRNWSLQSHVFIRKKKKKDSVCGNCSQEWTIWIRTSGFCLTFQWEKLKMVLIGRGYYQNTGEWGISLCPLHLAPASSSSEGNVCWQLLTHLLKQCWFAPVKDLVVIGVIQIRILCCFFFFFY